MNKDRLIEAEIGDNKERVYYRCAPCQGVKMCPEKGCNYIAPIREKRGCKNHTQQKLIRSEGCPVEMVYIYPENFKTDNRRWIGGIACKASKWSSYQKISTITNYMELSKFAI